MATHSSVLAWRIPGMGAWWAAVYGVTESWTLLMWLSSSGFHQEVWCVSCVCVSVCVKWTVIPFSLVGFATEQIISSLHSLLQNFWRVSQICSLLHWSKGGYYLATAILFWSSLFDSVKAMSSGILLKTWSSWFFLTLVWFGSKSISGKEFYSNGAGISSCVGYFHRLHLIVFFFFITLFVRDVNWVVVESGSEDCYEFLCVLHEDCAYSIP